MAYKLLPKYISLTCAATAAMVGVLTLLWVMGSSGAVAHAAGPSAFSGQRSAISDQQSAGSFQPSATAHQSSADLPPGASADWWTKVQEQLRREMPLSSLSMTATWTAAGESNGNWFGHSVATAGDVNGDGYADVVVGAYGYDNFNRRGKVYVYYGSADGLETAPAFTATGENDLDEFGTSLATAGDVNGDGYADVIVGAPSYAGSTGKMYVYYGSASGLRATPVFSIAGENPGDYFGRSVATAGDVNGDGYADVVVGAYGHSSQTGKIYVYRGSADGLVATPAFTATGSAGDYLGYSVATAGDVNGDGYADIVVGAIGYSSIRGKIYVYQGSATGLVATPVFTATGEASYDYFGYSVATAGDVDGDGYSDVVVGADNYGSNRGRAYVYRGSAAGLVTTPIFSATGETSSANFFGASVGTAGDVNGDGYADVVIGAYAYPNGTYQGKAYVYLGSANGLSTTIAFSAAGEPDAERFGISVATAGDVNGDGYADLIVGASDEEDFEHLQQGKAYVYHGSADGLGVTPAFIAFGETLNSYFGFSVATAGDVNGDGYADVVVGAYGYPNGEEKGKIYVYHGSAAGLSATPAFSATGENPDDFFGSRVATAGDVNGDGYADVVVGAIDYSSTKGRVYVYYGSPAGLRETGVVSVTGEGNGSYFGGSVAAGDVNGDGYSDVIVGAADHDGQGGKAYVYHGSAAGLNTTPTFSATGEFDGFGYSVASAGDVNGDGYGDAIVAGGRKVYVYHGSATGLRAPAAFVATGENSSDWFGLSVATAGDVNGDGYADIVVGADIYGSNYRGKVYVYHGSAAGLSATPAFTATGENPNNFFGSSVATAGDVNGDGYADIVVGAYYFGSNRQGKVYVYHGSAAGLNTTPGFTAVGETSDHQFGYSVDSAGDVNGDGYADIIVGNNMSGMRAYVFQGNGGAGLALRPRQMRSDGSVHIAPLGKSDSASTVQLRLTGRMPLGREKVKLEWQVAPLGTPFTAPSVISGTSAGWTDTLTTGAVIAQNVTGLTPGAAYHWRVRLRYRPGNPLGQSASRWLTIPWNGWTEQDFRTSQGEVNLVIGKSAAPVAAAPGAPITYTLLFSNTGNATASGVVITDIIPVGHVSNVTYTASLPLTPTGSLSYTWQAGDLTPGTGGIITLTGVLSHPLAAGTFANTATIAGATTEIVTANNRSAAEITVLNVAPVAVDDTYSAAEDTPLTIAATGVLSNDTDLNGDTLAAALAGDVLTGTLALNPGGGFVYTPALNYNGAVTFTYRSTDGLALSNLALVTITVSRVNDPPLAADDVYTAAENIALAVSAPGVLANDSDADGDVLTATLIGDVLTGTLALSLGGGFVYTPTLDYNGAVTFTYRATDGLALSNLALVTINVLSTPEADLSISKNSLRAGASITYTIVAGNGGPAAADGAAVFDPVPPGVAGFAWSCAAAGGAACGDVSGNGGISQTVSLPAGGTVTYTVTGTLVVSSATIVNTATITVPSGVDDPSPNNNLAVNYSGRRLYLPIILKNR